MTKDTEIGQSTIEHQETTAPPKLKNIPSRDLDVAMALFDTPEQIHEPRDPEEERKLVRKIDFMILPYLAVCYAFFYIDKTTLSYAGFYFGFLFWAFPTNFMMQRFPIGFFLMLQAAAKNFAQLLALRFLAGAAEACADPSFMLITSMWYTRKQQPVRMGLWYTANGIGIALGGLLGYAIGSIKGSLPSWKYEFLIIGALCCVWGIIMFIFLPDSPVKAKGLSLSEKRMAVQRLRENQTGIENKHLKSYQVKEAFRDVKLYLFFLLGVVGNVPNGGISNFGTLIIQGFGYSTLVTTLMQIPYGVIIAISILICVYLNDRFGHLVYASPTLGTKPGA
ncbi:putative mfs allantoate protein [Eutypa lata UCREL1]|uniref:Putative mfs allantoate protein n=1 Tax=Eutypa lata (strain UCR-EL1) TaxID=1287681 RepID=M7SUJ9_EUTLA|nr:putative mfs allantoate protein [Eutypa lata UCREL1]